MGTTPHRRETSGAREGGRAGREARGAGRTAGAVDERAAADEPPTAAGAADARRSVGESVVAGVVLAVGVTVALALLGCEPDRVEPDLFSRDAGATLDAAGGGPGRTDAQAVAEVGQAAPDAGTPLPSPDAGNGVTDASAPIMVDSATPSDAVGPAVDAPIVADGGGPVGPPDGGPPMGGAGVCDFTGRWLVAQRVLVTAAGQEQSARTWYYYEIQQQGAAFTVTRGLHCGYQVVKKSALGASVDSSGAWPAFLSRNSSTGRRGTAMEEAGGGCRFKLEREYVVRGATLPHYLDPAVKLPDRTQPAGPGMPGWEDWDGDGNPGITIRVSSALASGTLYDCQREWTEHDGVVAAGASKFKVGMRANNEHVVLGRAAGAPQTLETSSSVSSDLSQHYAWLHRLQAGQAMGTDAEICAAVRVLKDQLVPEAAQ